MNCAPQYPYAVVVNQPPQHQPWPRAASGAPAPGGSADRPAPTRQQWHDRLWIAGAAVVVGVVAYLLLSHLWHRPFHLLWVVPVLGLLWAANGCHATSAAHHPDPKPPTHH